MSNTRKRRRPQAATGNGGSLRARLATRQRPAVSYPLLVDDPTQARAKLDEAQRWLRQAKLRYDADAHAQARTRAESADDDQDGDRQAIRDELNRHDKAAEAMAEAEAATQAAAAEVDSCYATIRMQALRPEAYEALIAAHPPTAEQKAQPQPPLWNPDTFLPALLEACADGDMTAAAWAALLDGDDDGHGLNRTERWELRSIALGLNERARFADPAALPFVSTTTRS